MAAGKNKPFLWRLLVSALLLGVFLPPSGSAFATENDRPERTGPPIFNFEFLIGHVTWQGRPAQPNGRQMLPVSLVMRHGNTEVTYPTQTTDASGFFTVSVTGLPEGTYDWRLKDVEHLGIQPKHLANAGRFLLTSKPVTNVEMGLMRAGDCNGDNVVNAGDFGVLKPAFGWSLADSDFDNRADLNDDYWVNVTDFNLLKGNFSFIGAPPITVSAP